MKDLKLQKNKKAGFTVLFAVVAASLVLAIGLSIGIITLKEITISFSNRDSLMAFYAADSGAECARYYDQEEFDPVINDFASKYYVGDSPAHSSLSPGSIDCGTSQAQIGPISGNETELNFNFGANRFCTRVVVRRQSDDSIITSYGYNQPCTESPWTEPNSPRAVGRGYEI